MSTALSVAQGIVEGMPDPAVLIRADHAMLAHSVAFSDMVGVRRRRLAKMIEAGEAPFPLVLVDSQVETVDTCLANSKAMHFAEEVVKNQNGDELTVILSYLPVIEGDKAVGVIQIFRDVSAEARMQQRYHKLLGKERVRAANLEIEVEKRTRELREALEEVTRLSRVDPLTGLLNRRAFTELAEQSLKVARRHKRSMALLLGDLDFFKRINDDFGHMVGDRVLVGTASGLQGAVRDTDHCARFGGEEFVILLTETDTEAVLEVAERVREYVARTKDLGEDNEEWPTPTMSLGIALFPEHGDTLDTLVSNADKALYSAKENGRDQSVMYHDELENQDVGDKPAAPTQVVMLVGSNRPEAFSNAMGAAFEVVSVDDNDTAIDMCRHRRYEVFISDHEDPELGVDLLRRTQRVSPESVRILVIESQHIFLQIRGGGLARVDSFLLRDEAIHHISTAIDDAFVRREFDQKRVLLRTDSMKATYSERIEQLQEVIQHSMIRFHYQPIVDPRTRKVHAYEALCRAQHPTFKNPQLLFDMAAQSGHLWELGQAARKISVAGLAHIGPQEKIFLNLHPAEAEDPQLLEFAHSDIADRIVFEITERASISDFGRFLEMTSELRKRGFHFAIDDLGAGYAGLNAVALLSPEYIKIDMAIVRDVDKQPRRGSLIRRIVDFANDVGSRLIAEGIETKQEADTIAEIGCHFAQGYFYGRPEPLTKE